MGNGVHEELIRKKDALDALMAERKHLLDKGRWGAEHVLTHHGYNVIDELPTVQSDVPVINVGDMISREDAIKAICEDGTWLESQGCTEITMAERKQRDADIIDKLPSVQPKHGKWIPEYKNPCYNGYYKIPSYCSCCKDYYTQSPEEMNYCPNCGADMRGGKDGTD